MIQRSLINIGLILTGFYIEGSQFSGGKTSNTLHWVGGNVTHQDVGSF